MPSSLIGTSGLRIDRGARVYTVPAQVYAPQGVHFDGSTWLINAALSSSDNAFASFSVWFNIPDISNLPEIWVVDPINQYGNFFGASTSTTWIQQFGELVPTIDTLASTPFAPGSGWKHFIGSVNNTTGKLKGYLSDIAAGDPTIVTGTPTNPAFNGLPLWVGADSFSDNVIGDLADLRIFPGLNILDGSGDIPLATRRNFISASGHPVDPAVATAAYGAGAVLLSASTGNAGSFATNQGTGGAFATTGTLTLSATNP